METVGDAYLCVSGLPKPNGDQHASEIALMALEFMKTLQGFKMDQNVTGESRLKMRIGVYEFYCGALSNVHCTCYINRRQLFS